MKYFIYSSLSNSFYPLFAYQFFKIKEEKSLETMFTQAVEIMNMCNASLGHLLTWILGVASKQLRLLHGRVGDSTIVVNSLSPQMSELVEDAIAS